MDAYLATPHPAFPGLGSTTSGLSTSWSSRDCGTFTYAAGLRNVEQHKRLTPASLMSLASMTKPIIAALTLMLNDYGAFGAGGLDTTVDQLLTPQQIAALTTGDDPTHPRCPGSALLLNRQTQAFELSAFSCPDLSKVTLRHLMVSNHGMYDFLNEVGSPGFFSQYVEGVYFDVLQAVGIPATPPPNSNSGYDVLKAYGLKGNISAVIGGNLASRDLEISFGNTGFQLLGVILEHRTGRSLDDLIRTLIVEPLRTDDIFVYVDPRRRRNQIADGYDVETGEPLIETTGVYPLVSVNGHTAVNTLNLGLGHPGNVNLAGGAGGLVANQKSYRRFLDAFVNGGLLGADAQAALDTSFIFAAGLEQSSRHCDVQRIRTGEASRQRSSRRSGPRPLLAQRQSSRRAMRERRHPPAGPGHRPGDGSVLPEFEWPDIPGAIDAAVRVHRHHHERQFRPAVAHRSGVHAPGCPRPKCPIARSRTNDGPLSSRDRDSGP